MTAASGNLEGGEDRPTQVLRLSRAHQVAEMLVAGRTRRQVLRHAAEHWSMPTRTCDRLIQAARQLIIDDWRQDRQEVLGTLLSQLSVVYRRALRENQLSVALGAINSFARLAQLTGPAPPSVSPGRYTPHTSSCHYRGLPPGEN